MAITGSKGDPLGPLSRSIRPGCAADCGDTPAPTSDAPLTQLLMASVSSDLLFEQINTTDTTALFLAVSSIGLYS